MSPRSCLPCVAWLLLVSGVWGALGAQEETSATPPAESPAEPEAAPPPPSPPSPPPAGEGAGEGAERAEEVRAASEPTSESDLYLPLGPNLFPFYTHQLRTSDQTEILHILGLYRRTRSRRDGSHSLLILPFYFRDHAVSPPDDRLFLFPFYYHGVSPERAYRHLAPFYFSSSDPRSSFQLLLPFWMRETQEGGKLINHRVVPPLFRATWDDRLEDRSVFSMRLGFGKLLEFFEYRATPLTTDLAFVNFLNWGDVAESGGALYSYRWIQEDSGVRGRTHLFPFYWHGQGIESRYLWTIPLFGYWGTGGRDDYVVLPLLSRFGSGPGKDIRLNVLYRLFQYEQSEDEFSLAAMPFFNIFRSPSRHGFGVLTWIYTYAYDSEADRVDHTALWPFFHYSRTADDREGRQWLFPYYDTWDDEQATTLVLPIYGKRESRINGQPDRYFAVGLPTYFSFGTPTDYFSTGFPLYWAARTGERGWGVFFPFYLNFYSAVSQDLHVLPFFSNLRSPSRKLLAFGGPLYQYTRYYNSEERPSGSGHSLLWPFITVENRDDGYHYRFLPFFWVSKDQAASDLLLTPFYYHQSGEQGTLRYFFPAYARHQTPRVRRDFYALGTYMTSEYYAEDGALTESSRNFLWSLASFQKNHATQSTHQRILPLGFWRTSSPTEDLTVAGPFYYSHRRLAGDQVHHLQLFLGNLFLSKKVEGPPPREGPEVLRPVARDPGDAGEGDGEGDGRSTPGAPLERVVRSREGGVFWPLSRWYWNDQGSEGHWLLPFYFRTRSENTRTVGVFPLYFGQRNEGDYEPSYFRYFFLFDRETWSTGHRWSVAQLLFDYREDEVQSERRLRLLYPLFEIGSSETQYSYQVTPLLTGESVVASGGRSRTNRFFPLFWEGSRERVDADGRWTAVEDHFFLFPFYGFERTTTRVHHYLLFPLFHLQKSSQSLSAEFWPLVFYRDRPGLQALRFWPLHASESGEDAGDFWVSKYLFLSKFFRNERETSYRLDPFLFRTRVTPDEFEIAGLFEALAYETSPTETSFRAIPFAFGKATEDSAITAVIPLHYRKDHGTKPIDYYSPWRLFFLTSSLKGAGGERHFSVFTKLFDITDNPERPDYLEIRFLHQLFFYYRSETAKQVEFNPFFQYYRDDTEQRTVFSIFFSLYRQETVRGQTRRTLFFFIPF